MKTQWTKQDPTTCKVCIWPCSITLTWVSHNRREPGPPSLPHRLRLLITNPAAFAKARTEHSHSVYGQPKPRQQWIINCLWTSGVHLPSPGGSHLEILYFFPFPSRGLSEAEPMDTAPDSSANQWEYYILHGRLWLVQRWARDLVAAHGTFSETSEECVLSCLGHL